jgi:tetratricopeptide (TPR) repeat protein
MVLNSLGSLRAKAAQQERDPVRALVLLREAADLHHRALGVDPAPQTFRGLSQIHGLMSLYDRPNATQHHREAARFSRRALELAQQRKIATPDFVLVHGVDLVNAGQLAQGIELLRWYVQAEPDSVTGLVNLGGALTLAGRGADAIPLLTRACALEPNDRRTWVGLARAQQAIGDDDAALASWLRAQRLAPEDAAIAEQIRALEAAR